MSEQDRLAALLERATRERRGADGAVEERPDGPTAQRGGDAASTRAERGGRAGEDAEGNGVSGGEWLPPDPGRHRTERGRPRVLTLPASVRSANLAVRPTAVIALLVVALLAAGIFALRWWRAEQGSEPVPVAPLAAQRVPVSGAPGGAGHAGEEAGTAGDDLAPVEPPDAEAPVESGSPSAGAPTEDEDLLVHVAGEVERPGVVRLEGGSRVQDAVDAAGGLGDGADTSRLNLARPVADGERIWVPRPGEDVPEVADTEGGPGPGGPPGGGEGSSVGEGAEPININTADQAVLEELPGVGPVTAAAIVQWRTEQGQFSTPDELLEVSGIGEATLEKLRPHITL